MTPEESPVGASAANAVIERSVWEMQSTTRAIVAYAESVHDTVFEPGSAILAWTVKFSGQVVSSFHRSVSDGKTAYERRVQKSYRKALVPFGELLMFMPVEKPRTRVTLGTALASCWVSWADLTSRRWHDLKSGESSYSPSHADRAAR